MAGRLSYGSRFYCNADLIFHSLHKLCQQSLKYTEGLEGRAGDVACVGTWRAAAVVKWERKWRAEIGRYFTMWQGTDLNTSNSLNAKENKV